MKHLSQEQISSLVAGISVPDGEHARECAECGREVERVRSILLQFRISVRESSARGRTDRPDPGGISIREAIASREVRSRSLRRAPMAWVFAAAVIAAAVALPMYHQSREQELKLQAERDAQLLDDVNAQLSRSGPIAMDSLMRLMVFPDGGTGAASRDSHANPTGPGKKEE